MSHRNLVMNGSVDIKVQYFFYLPLDNIVVYAEEPKSETSAMRYYGSLSNYLHGLGFDTIPIPMPAELVRQLGWVDIDTIGRNYGMSEAQLAALSLVKGM